MTSAPEEHIQIIPPPFQTKPTISNNLRGNENEKQEEIFHNVSGDLYNCKKKERKKTINELSPHQQSNFIDTGNVYLENSNLNCQLYAGNEQFHCQLQGEEYQQLAQTQQLKTFQKKKKKLS
jgi:hypothetical protein